MRCHPSWNQGLGLLRAPGPLPAADYIDAQEASRDEVADRCRELFSFDQRIVQNPAGSAVPERSCCWKHWGLCKDMEELPMVNLAVFNFHCFLKQHCKKKTDLPTVARFRFLDHEVYALVVDMYGKGIMQWCLLLSPIDGALELQIVQEAAGSVVATAPSHLVFLEFVRKGGANFEGFEASLMPPRRCPSADRLRLALDEQQLTATVAAISVKVRAARRQRQDRNPTVVRLPFGIPYDASSSRQLAAAENSEKRLTADSGSDDAGADPNTVRDEGRDARSSESDESESDDEITPGSQGPPTGGPPGEPPQPPPQLAGLRAVEFSPSSRAVCFICGSNGLPSEQCKIQEGTIRFSCIPKLGKPRCLIHATCAGQMPNTWIAGSVQWLNSAVAAADLDPALREMLFSTADAIDARMAPHSGAAAASSAG